MQRSPRALDHASVLPRTVVSLVQSRMLSENNWGCRNWWSMSRYDVDVIVASEKKMKIRMDRKCAVGWGPAPGCDRPFSSVWSARFTTQWTLGRLVPEWDDVLTLLDSALSPVIWSPQFTATSTTTQNDSRHTVLGSKLAWSNALRLLRMGSHQGLGEEGED